MSRREALNHYIQLEEIEYRLILKRMLTWWNFLRKALLKQRDRLQSYLELPGSTWVYQSYLGLFQPFFVELASNIIVGIIALSLRKLQKKLIEEKLEAIKADEDKSHKKKFKFSHIGLDIREAVKKFFRKLFKCSETSCGYQTCYKLEHEGSCENYVLKSILGFIAGVFLTYFFYIVFLFQLNVKLSSATVICSIMGCVLTVGLAFSSKVRCVVLLTLPQFFSKRGRQALLAYAFVLALTGPAQNTLNNMSILSESLACGQEQLKQAVKQIIDVIKKPFMAIKEAIKNVVKTVKEIVKKIKEILLKIKRVIMALVRVIKSAFEFLGKMINICNKELGTPFERCTRVFENAITDCNAKLGPLFNWLCSLTYIVKAVCYIVKIFDYVCMLVDFISTSVVGVIIRKVKTFIRHIKTMFYVRIKFSHSFEYETKSSKNFTEIGKEIVAEIKGRSRKLVAFFKIMTSASMLFFLYLIFQVAYYRIKYLTSERFDNFYINKYFREIDRKRAKIGRETVLPLTKKEQQTYVPISSGKLAKKERTNLTKSATSLATASVKLGTHMAADYCLYWILTLVSHHARYQSKVQAPNLPVAHISGEGFLATLLRSIVTAFQPAGIKLEIDTVPCLPIPIPPDFDRYVQIGITILFCLILTILEPYGLRFRNYIMGYYHPLRAKQRTIWLYNHILRSRTSFLLMARRNLRKKFGMHGRGDEISCKDWLKSKLKCSIFRICLGSDLQQTCLLCGEVFREKEKTRFIKCHTPRCPGLFCLECFADLKNICPVCLLPLEYGDLDDLDEEKDSSDDDSPPPDTPKKKRKCPWFPCGKTDDDDAAPLISKDEVSKEEHEEIEEEQDEENPPPQDENKEDAVIDNLEKVAEESDSSTDYSYSYQYDKDYANKQPLPTPTVWRDVEMQAMSDEVSMDTFWEEEEYLSVEFDNKIRVPKGHVAMVRMDVSAEVAEELDDGKNKDQIEDNDENQPLLDQCTCSLSSSPRHVEFIGLPQGVEDFHKNVRRKIRDLPSDPGCICSDSEDLDEYHRTSTMSTSTRSDCKYCRCPEVDIRSTLKAGSETEEDLRNVVPKIDLSFLEKEDKCTCDNPVLSSRFSYVTYQVESETPPSERSLDSSSVISSLQRTPTADSEGTSVLRKRNLRRDQRVPTGDLSSSSADSQFPHNRKQKNARTQYSVPQENSPNPISSYDFHNAQKRRVKQYYDATKEICTDSNCQNVRKRNSISQMFKRLLPKRNRGQTYLPLQNRDINADVQIQSYNYNQENWETLSIDTNSPTYPFGTRASSDTSEEEEEQTLLGGRRIRGGECTHLINCRLIGRKCPQKRGKPFDAKSEFTLGRTRLKDFSTLSLPPKPKPADSKELFSRYFSNIDGSKLPRNPENSMKPVEVPKSIDSKESANPFIREDSSESIISKDAVSTLNLAEDATSPSSDSGLSETTCAALFGRPYPQGVIKSLQERSETLPEIPIDEPGAVVERESISDERVKIQTSTLKEDTLDNELSAKKSKNSDSQISTRKGSQQSFIEKNQTNNLNEESLKDELTTRGTASIEILKSKSSKLSLLKGQHEDIGEANQSEQSLATSQPAKSAAKRKSTQLNQLLYKDERTQISLVQKLSPEKGTDKTRSISTGHKALSPRPAPSVKLQISLHNSIIPEEEEEEGEEAGFHIDRDSNIAIEKEGQEPVIMAKSQDKIVETKDSFPLQYGWLSPNRSETGKLILSSDKTQQTSDNNFYRAINESEIASQIIKKRPSTTLESSEALHTHPQTSQTAYTSSGARAAVSGAHYSHELPEKDEVCKNNCRCSICRVTNRDQQVVQEPESIRDLNNDNIEIPYIQYVESPLHTEHMESQCSCCRCSNRIKSRRPPYRKQHPPLASRSEPSSSNANYQVTAFPPSTTDTEFQEFLPPPPPRPPFPPRMYLGRRSAPPVRRRGYRKHCDDQCDCYLRSQYPKPMMGYSGDYAQASTSFRYPTQTDSYGYPEQYNNAPYDVDQYDYSNPESSLSDLPYQNNEEYMELVQELQDTLHSRNRNRVKRAMQEFEDKSKQNMPLEKPIIHYDENSESEEPIIRKIDRFRTDRRQCCSEDKCTCCAKKEPTLYPKPPKPRRAEVLALSSEEKASHWTMDPNSGEWHRGSDDSKYRRPRASKHEEEEHQCTCNCNCERRYK